MSTKAMPTNKITELHKAALRRFHKRIYHPDNIGEAEYRAVYETLYDQLSQGEFSGSQDPLDLLDGMLDQFIDSAKHIQKRLRRKAK